MKKLSVFLIGICALILMDLHAELTLEMEPTEITVVNGFDTTMTQKVAVYLTTGGESLSKFHLLFNLPKGVNMSDGVNGITDDGNTTSVKYNENIIIKNNVDLTDEGEIVPALVYENGEHLALDIAIAQNITARLAHQPIFNQISGRTEICQIEFTVDLTQVEDNVDLLSLTLDTAEMIDATNDSEITDVNVDALKLTFKLMRKSYSFDTKKDAKLELQEDASAVTIAATDTTYFEALVWSTTENRLVPATNVVFTAPDDDVAISDDETAGTVEIQDGKIVYTPAENYEGDFTITCTAVFPDLDNAKVENVHLPVVVEAVKDNPIITFDEGELSFKETEDVVSFTIKFVDPDDGDDWNEDCATVTLGGKKIDGAWGDIDDNGYVTFTASDKLSYETLAHPTKEADLPLVVSYDDGSGDEYARASEKKTVKVYDKDQPADFGSINVTIEPEDAYVTDALKAIARNENITDADGDVEAGRMETTYKWYLVGSEEVKATGATLAAGVAKKGETWKAEATWTIKPYENNTEADELDYESASTTITIKNSAPTAASDELFIRKGGDEPIGRKTIDIKDNDEEDKEKLQIVLVGAENGQVNTGKGTVALSDDKRTIIYTVKDADTEFDAADIVLFKVTDGEDESAGEPYELKVMYKDNPLPVVEITGGVEENNTVAVNEVDAAGNASEFTINFKATDPIVEDPGITNGIKKVECTVENAADKELLDIVEDVTYNDNADPVVGSFKFKVAKGIDTLQGAGRDASKTVNVIIKATDKDNAPSETVTIAVVIADVDRAPVAPDLAVAIDPEGPTTSTTLTAELSGKETAKDEDGDKIEYEYKWTVKRGDDEPEEYDGDTLASDNIQKGDKVTVSVRAKSTPAYEGGEPKYTDWVVSEEVEILNTAPTLELFDEGILEAQEDPEEAVRVGLDTLVTVIDPDLEDDVEETKTFSIAPIDPSIGTVTCEKNELDEWEVVFMPAKDYYNTKDGSPVVDLPTFVVKVTDASKATAEIPVKISVEAVNDDPTVNISKVIVPVKYRDKEEEFKKTIKFSVGPKNESDQTIAELNFENNDIANEIIDGAITYSVDNQDKIITLTIHIKKDAPEKKVGTVTFTLKDSEDGEYEGQFEIVVGGVPWYPEFTLKHDDDDLPEGLVAQFDQDGETFEIVVKKNEKDEYVLTPGMYVPYFAGFKSGIPVISPKVYPWSTKEGMVPKAYDVKQEENGTVYEVPGAPEVTQVDGKAAVNVVAGDASAFELKVFAEDADVEKAEALVTVNYTFQADKDGGVETEKEIELANLTSGTYQVVVIAYNPEGPSEKTVENITIADDDKTDWADMDGFVPVDTLTITGNRAPVKFQWPVNADASNYILYVYDGNGWEVANVKTAVNTAEISLYAGTYRWYVETDNGDVSKMNLLNIFQKAGSKPVITGGSNTEDTITLTAENLDDGKTYTYEVFYYAEEYQTWYYQVFTAIASEGELTLSPAATTLYVNGEHYIMIRLKGDTGEFQTLLINNVQ